MTDHDRITLDDLRRAGYCAPGAKGWFAQYRLDFRDFVFNGIDRETFLNTGDAMAKRVVELKDKDAGRAE